MAMRSDLRGTPFFNALKKQQQQQHQPPSSSSAVSSLRSGNDNDPVSLLEKEDFEPTEEELTETEQNEESYSSFLNDDQAVIVTSREMAAASSGALEPTILEDQIPESCDAKAEQVENDEKNGNDGLCTVEMLLGMLNEANRPDAYSLRRRLKQPNRNLELEDLTKILSHVNICEESETDPRWDVIYELAYGNHSKSSSSSSSSPQMRRRRKRRSMQQEQEVEGMIALDVQSSGSSRLPKMLEQSDGDCDDEDDDEIEEDCEEYQPQEGPKQQVPVRTRSGDSQSLSLGDVVAHSTAESASIFTLDANTHSVDSSVTWYEGADITEIEISEDDLEEFLPTYSGNFSFDSEEEGSDANSRDSTPPPPPDANILYTPPPMDYISLGEEDSLSRVYRRRRTRRYADTE